MIDPFVQREVEREQQADRLEQDAADHGTWNDLPDLLLAVGHDIEDGHEEEEAGHNPEHRLQDGGRHAGVQQRRHIRDMFQRRQQRRGCHSHADQQREEHDHAKGNKLLADEVAGLGVIDDGEGLFHGAEQRRAAPEQADQPDDEQDAAGAFHSADGPEQLALVPAPGGDRAEDNAVDLGIGLAEDAQRETENCRHEKDDREHGEKRVPGNQGGPVRRLVFHEFRNDAARKAGHQPVHSPDST